MAYLIIFLILFLIVLIVFARREAKKHGTSAGEEFVGICKLAVETASQKEARKERVLELLRTRGEMGNAEIRAELGVASRTVVKYMDELEREGRVEQIGNIGQGVIYRPK